MQHLTQPKLAALDLIINCCDISVSERWKACLELHRRYLGQFPQSYCPPMGPHLLFAQRTDARPIFFSPFKGRISGCDLTPNQLMNIYSTVDTFGLHHRLFDLHVRNSVLPSNVSFHATYSNLCRNWKDIYCTSTMQLKCIVFNIFWRKKAFCVLLNASQCNVVSNWANFIWG